MPTVHLHASPFRSLHLHSPKSLSQHTHPLSCHVHQNTLKSLSARTPSRSSACLRTPLAKNVILAANRFRFKKSASLSPECVCVKNVPRKFPVIKEGGSAGRSAFGPGVGVGSAGTVTGKRDSFSGNPPGKVKKKSPFGPCFAGYSVACASPALTQAQSLALVSSRSSPQPGLCLATVGLTQSARAPQPPPPLALAGRGKAGHSSAQLACPVCPSAPARLRFAVAGTR